MATGTASVCPRSKLMLTCTAAAVPDVLVFVSIQPTIQLLLLSINSTRPTYLQDVPAPVVARWVRQHQLALLARGTKLLQ